MRITACGDVALCRNVEQMIIGGKERQLAGDVRKLLRNADVVVANVECPLTDCITPRWRHPVLKGRKANGYALGRLGVGIASLANNHIADFGREGLADTISVLKEQGIVWVGAGWTPEDAARPVVVERAGHRIGVLALAQPEASAARYLGWGAGVLRPSDAIKRMEKLSGHVDFAVAYLHFGVEFCTYPTPQQVWLSRELVEAGAGLVIGHHPHVPQGYEYYKHGFIAYSLGNFIFDFPGGIHKFSRLGLLVQADVEQGRLVQVEVICVETGGGNPRLIHDCERSEAEKYLIGLSSVLKDDEELYARYYFTCRDHLELHLKALKRFALKDFAWRRTIGNVLGQFWPQILRLRIDIIRFLLSGEAYRLESKRDIKVRSFQVLVWRFFCYCGLIIGYGWGRFVRVKRKGCLAKENEE